MLELLMLCAGFRELKRSLRLEISKSTGIILNLVISMNHQLSSLNLIATQNVFIGRNHPFEMQAKPRFVHLINEMV